MRRPVLTLVLAFAALTTFRCGGEAEPAEIEQLAAYDFTAKVSLQPSAPAPGERVYVNVDLVSHSSRPVMAGVELTVMDDRGGLVHRKIWEQVGFDSPDTYALIGSFLTESNIAGKTATAGVRVLSAADGGVLFESGSLASFRAQGTAAPAADGGR